MAKANFLIVEDDPELPNLFKAWIASCASFANIEISVVQTLEEARKLAPGATVIILDLILPDSPDAELTLASIIPDLRPYAPVFVVTGAAGGGMAADSDILIKAVRHYGAAYACPKTMLTSKADTEWFMLSIQNVLGRRIFEAHKV